jgi:predicted nucleic acid-binding protein
VGRQVVLDASVLIGILDPSDAQHAAAVAAVDSVRHEDLVVPASAYSEVLVHPNRRGPAVAEEVARFFTDFPIRVQPIGAEIARRAAELRAQWRKLTLGDALVLATGDELDAAVVLTGDGEWPEVDPRARAL